MRRKLMLVLLASLLLVAHASCQSPVYGGEPVQDATVYKLRLPVDEVTLTFHAEDAHGASINDLKIDDLKLFDNGKPPRSIVAFDLVQDAPIHAGILIDTSESMETQLPANRSLAMQYVQQLLRASTDQAFVIDFGYVSKIEQPWSNDPNLLATGIGHAIAGRQNPLGGTALFDTVFRACFNEFAKVDHAASGNFILLLTDGQDNISHTSIEEAVDQCQRANVAIYAFHAEALPGPFSAGPNTLTELASKTGGRVFRTQHSDAEVKDDLGIIEGDLRNHYRLIYTPADLKHDSSFHRIELHGPDRVEALTIRFGYYDRPR